MYSQTKQPKYTQNKNSNRCSPEIKTNILKISLQYKITFTTLLLIAHGCYGEILLKLLYSSLHRLPMATMYVFCCVSIRAIKLLTYDIWLLSEK